ncbi:MAG: MATE family efflux transporter [Acutalibacteraceae bacterium]
MLDCEDIQYKKMTGTPVGRLILSLAVPTVISMLVTAIYNTADTYFVAHLSSDPAVCERASGAVGIILPLMSIMQALGFGIGMGSGSIVSRLLGKRDIQAANKTAISAVSMAAFSGLVIAVLGSVFLEPIVRLLGASNATAPYAMQYGRYIVLAAPVMMCSFVLNNLLRFQGMAKLSMLGLAFGGILNIALDPLFIFVFGLETAGAAIATIISQTLSFLILLSFFLRRKTTLSLNLKNLDMDFKRFGLIIYTGLPSIFRQVLSSVSLILLNRAALSYGGDSAVSAVSIVGKIFMILFSVMLGIGQGYQPVLGYNYGAKKWNRCRYAAVFLVLFSTAVLSVMGTAAFIFAEKVMSFMIDGNSEVMKIGVLALRAQCFSLIFIPLCVSANMTYQTSGQAAAATFLSSLRQGIFFIPVILILPLYIGLNGVIITQTVSDILTFAVSLPFFIAFIRKMNKNIESEEKQVDN